MNRALGAALAASFILLASPANAQVSLDFKVAYALPIGFAEQSNVPPLGNVPMSGAWSGAIPIELAARYLVTPNISMGVYFQYAPPSWRPPPAPRGELHGLRHANRPRARLRLPPGRPPPPLVQLRDGWEWTHYSVDTAIQSSGVTWSGWEVVNVQTGLDFALGKAFALGPYVGYFGGMYSNISASGGAQGYGGSVDVSARSFHGWCQAGLKGSLNL